MNAERTKVCEEMIGLYSQEISQFKSRLNIFTSESGYHERASIQKEIDLSKAELVYWQNEFKKAQAPIIASRVADEGNEPEATCEPKTAELNAVEFLNKEMAHTSIERDIDSEGLDLILKGKLAVSLVIKERGKYQIDTYLDYFADAIVADAIVANQFARLIQLAAGIALKWEALHMTEDGLEKRLESQKL